MSGSMFIISKQAGTGTITFDSTTDNSRVQTYSLDWQENNPRVLRLTIDNGTPYSTSNLLSSSCNLWAGSYVGAISLGDFVQGNLWTTLSPTSAIRCFDGVITDIKANSGGVIEVTATDFLLALKNKKTDKVIFNSYRDQQVFNMSATGGIYQITGVTDAGIVTPVSEVSLGLTETRTTLGTGTSEYGIPDAYMSTSTMVAQAFVSTDNAFLGFRGYYEGLSHAEGTITCVLCQDNSNAPGATIATVNVAVDNTGNFYKDFDFVTSNSPVFLEPETRYWLKFYFTPAVGSDWCAPLRKTNATGAIISEYVYSIDSGSNWTHVASHNLTLIYDTVNYISEDVSKCYIDESTDVINVFGETTVETRLTDPAYTYYEASVSYYYGTKTLEQVFESLIETKTGIRDSVSTDCDRTFKTYSTRGRDYLTCCQELCDIYEISGTYNLYQHVIAHYSDDTGDDDAIGNQYIKVGFRSTLTDGTNAATFSHGWDSTTDSELRIISANLKKINNGRYSQITVIGKGMDGNPITATVTDRALSTSIGGSMPQAMAPIYKVYNEDIRTVSEAYNLAFSLLDRMNTNAWEGSIILSGCYPDLIQTSTSSAYYGSGRIITLNWSPLGITSTKFKVKGIIATPTTTEVIITNADILNDNAYTRIQTKTNASEAFIAPVGTPTNVYYTCYHPSAVTTASLYASLENEYSAITGLSRVLCSKITDSNYTGKNYNCNIYHAEFESWNGYTTSASPVSKIILYTAASGGTATATYDLYDTGPPINDERFWKWKDQRVIIDVITKQA